MSRPRRGPPAPPGAPRRPAAPARRRPSLGRRTARRLGGLLAGLAVLAAVILGLAQHRLRQGPVELPIIAEFAAARLAAGGGPVRWRIGGAAFALGAPGAPSGLVFRDVAAIGPAGRVLAEAPLAAFDLALGDLVAGRVRPSAIQLSGVSLTLLRRSDGSIGLLPLPPAAEAEPEPAPGAVAPETEAAARLLEGPEGPLGAVAALEATQAELILRDAVSGEAWRLSGARLRLLRGEGRDAMEMSGLIAPLARPGTPPARVVVAGARDRDSGALSVTARFEGAALAEIAAAAPELAPLAAIEATASGELRLEQTATGALRAFEARLALGAGRIAGWEGPAGAFEAAEARVAWDPAGRRLRIERLAAEGAMGAVEARGAVAGWPARPDLRPQGAPDPSRHAPADARLDAPPPAAPAGWRLSLTLDRLALTEAAGFGAPIAFERGALEADVIPGRRRIEVPRLSLGSPALSLEASAAIEEGPEGPTLAAHLRSDGFAAEALVAHWPLEAAPGGRRWVAANLRAGRIREVEGWLWIAPGAPPALSLDFAFAEAAATVVPGLPPVEGVRGRGRASLERLELVFEAGRAAAPGRGAARLAAARFTIPDLAADPPLGEADLSVSGRLPDLLAILDSPPLGLVSKLGADLSSFEGTAEVSARLSLPLLRDLKLTEIDVAAEAGLTDVSGRSPGGEVEVAARRLELAADMEALSLAGEVTLAGLPARLAWRERYGPAGPGREVRLSGALDGDALRGLGLESPEVRAGRVAVDLVLEGTAAPAFRLDARLDDAALALPAIGWSKPRGAPGRLRASGRAGPEGLSAEGFRLEAGDLSASGAARIGPDGGVRAVTLERLALGEALDVTLSLERDAATGALSAEVGGPLIDIGALSRRAALSGGGGGEAGPPLDARIRVERVVAAPGFALHDARGRLTREGDTTRARLRGEVNGGGLALLRWRDAPAEEPLLSLRTEDAGRMLADLGLSRAAAGGKLVLRARIPRDGAGDVAGVARIEGIRVSDAAAFGRVVDEAASDGMIDPEARRLGADEGWTFDSVRVPFTLAGSELRVEDALAVGPALGVKLRGAYDRAAERLDFSGVLTPAYAVNSLLNRIPILGELLGGEGEGLIGLTFAVEGPRDAPSISANPLSVLAPGLLRRLLQPGEPPEEPPDLFENPDR